MKDEIKEFVAVAMIVLGTLTLTVVGCLDRGRVNQLEREAVERGHAEWFSETPGEAPNQWRWKQ